MSAIFCSSCGQKHEYNHATPKFCSGCGSPLGAVMPTSKKTVSLSVGDNYDDDVDDDDNTNILRVPQLRKLDFEIETFPTATITLGTILNQKHNQSPHQQRRRSSVDDFVTNKSSRGE